MAVMASTKTSRRSLAEAWLWCCFVAEGCIDRGSLLPIISRWLGPDPEKIGRQAPGERGGGADDERGHVRYAFKHGETVDHQPVHDQGASGRAVVAHEARHGWPGVAEDPPVGGKKFAQNEHLCRDSRGHRQWPEQAFVQYSQEAQFEQARRQANQEP